MNFTNKNRKNLPQTADIFQLYINHGRNVKNGSYAYIVYGGKELAANAFKNMPIGVLENSTDIQAISWGDNYIGASFYNSNKALKTNDFEISVSAPCALMFEKNNRKYTLSVTDAEMNKNLKDIVVKTTLNIGGANVSKNGKWNVVTVPMSLGKWCGKPAKMLVEVK